MSGPRDETRLEERKTFDFSHPEFVNAAEAAVLIGTSPRTVVRWIVEGRLPAFRPGRRYAISRKELVQFMLDNRVGAEVVPR